MKTKTDKKIELKPGFTYRAVCGFLIDLYSISNHQAFGRIFHLNYGFIDAFWDVDSLRCLTKDEHDDSWDIYCEVGPMV